VPAANRSGPRSCTREAQSDKRRSALEVRSTLTPAVAAASSAERPTSSSVSAEWAPTSGHRRSALTDKVRVTLSAGAPVSAGRSTPFASTGSSRRPPAGGRRSFQWRKHRNCPEKRLERSRPRCTDSPGPISWAECFSSMRSPVPAATAACASSPPGSAILTAPPRRRRFLLTRMLGQGESCLPRISSGIGVLVFARQGPVGPRKLGGGALTKPGCRTNLACSPYPRRHVWLPAVGEPAGGEQGVRPALPGHRRLAASEGGRVRFLLVSGKPIGEPIACVMSAVALTSALRAPRRQRRAPGR
jgi:hypothetical protein